MKEKKLESSGSQREIFVRISDPKLIIIRNNLRRLILKEYYKRSHKLIENDYNEYKKIDEALKKSIVFCPNCQSSEKDMVKTKVKRQWVCLDCYNLYKNMFKKELEEVKTLLRARTKRGEGIHLEYFGEENLNVLSEDLKEKFREWGGKINEKDELIVPKEHIEEFLNHLDELECPWI